jgi:hypothetical protein
LIMRLATGLRDVSKLSPEDVFVWDWAWALSQINRFLGQTPVPWSVLSHTGLVYQLAMRATKGTLNPLDQIGILLHDAPEAYIGDVPRPLKDKMCSPIFHEVEQRILETMLARLGITYGDINWEIVKRYDNQAAYHEYDKFFGLPPVGTPGHSFAPEYEPVEVNLNWIVSKPLDYASHLKHLVINLPNCQDEASLFEIPAYLTPYLVDAPEKVMQQAPEFSEMSDDAVSSLTI